SSIAFDAAYIRRPVVYYQFDRGQVFRGAHTVRQGYFSYDEDGFGPVTKTADVAVSAVAELVSRDFAVGDEYRVRMEKTFPQSDDQNCERVLEAIAIREVPAARFELGEVPIAPRPRPSPRD